MAIGMGVILAIQSLLLYHFVWAYANNESLVAYWSDGFVRTGESYLHFILNKSNDLFLQSLKTQSRFISANSFPENLFYFACYVFSVAGICGCIFKKKIEYALILISPLVAAGILNFLHRWPYGALRVNVFLLSLMLLICFLVGVWQNRLLSRIVGLFFICWFGILTLPVDRGAFAVPPPYEDSRSVLRKLREELKTCEPGKVWVLMNPAIANSKDYYLNYDSRFRNEMSEFYSQCVSFEKTSEAYSDPHQVQQSVQQKMRSNTERSVWMIYSHLSKGEIQSLVEVASSQGQISKHSQYEGAGLFLIH